MKKQNCYRKFIVLYSIILEEYKFALKKVYYTMFRDKLRKFLIINLVISVLTSMKTKIYLEMQN